MSKPANDVKSQRNSLPPVRTDTLENGCLLEYFKNAWDLYEMLLRSIVRPGALYESPDPLRHPLVFYLGHPAAFYVNKLRMAGCLGRAIDPDLERLFAVGVDPQRQSDLLALRWPDEATVWGYRSAVFDLMCGVIGDLEIRGPVSDRDPAWAVLMGIEHDRIHFETSSVLIRQYPVDSVDRPEDWIYAPSGSDPGANDWIHIPGGDVVIGKPPDHPTFGWDSEYGRLETRAPDFLVSRNLVSNREYLEFVRDEGYARRDLWTSDGWNWIEAEAMRHPRFWRQSGGAFRYRAMFDEFDLPLYWPVEVTCHEAEAFCAWKGGGARLPSEAEWVRMSGEVPAGDDDPAYSDNDNLNLKYGSPSPCGIADSTRSPRGLSDVFGNVWTWLRDDFYPLPGFTAHPWYEEFSAPYFDDQHAILRGGSWASLGTSASRFYRTWFRRSFHQHAGFRMARPLGPHSG